MRKLRISAISYLNTAPLMWDFEHSDSGRDFDISYTLPSRCAAALQQGSADIGIIPAAAYTEIPHLAVIPGVAIASRRAVRSILLVARCPVREVQSVALDTSSMTSVALTRVLFANWWHAEPSFHPAEPDLDSMLSAHDSALLIGDPALQVDRSKYETYDLAEEWIRFTGKPFVFAFWAVRTDAVDHGPADLAAIFQRSRDHGISDTSVRQIAYEWAPRLGLTENSVGSYLSSNIFYFLDEACLAGLNLFYDLAARCGALPRVRSIDFLELAKAVKE